MGVTGVQAKLSALQSDFSDVSDAFAALGVRVDTDDTNARIAKATSDLAARLDSSAAALESKVASVETELSARIDGCVSDAASLESRLVSNLNSAGDHGATSAGMLTAQIAQLRDKFTSETANVNTRIDQEVSNISSMVSAEVADIRAVLIRVTSDAAYAAAVHTKLAHEGEMGVRLKAARARVGHVTCSIMWNNKDDLDLHCESDAGGHISSKNTRGK